VGRSATAASTGSLQKARQTPVREKAALGLTALAVDDLVRLVGDPEQGLTADRTGPAGAIVHCEAGAELGLRQAPVRRRSEAIASEMTDRTTATKRRRSDSFSELRDEKGDKPARFSASSA